MKQPQLNLRIAEQHQDLIRAIAQRLREHDGDSFAAHLSAFLDEQEPTQTVDAGDLAFRVDELEERLEALQAYVLKRLEALEPQPTTTKRLSRSKTAAPAEPVPQRVHIAPAPESAIREGDFIPESIRSQASALQRTGMSWEAIWAALGEPSTVDELRIQTAQWRKRYHVSD